MPAKKNAMVLPFNEPDLNRYIQKIIKDIKLICPKLFLSVDIPNHPTDLTAPGMVKIAAIEISIYNPAI